MRTVLFKIVQPLLLLACSCTGYGDYKLEVVAEYPHDTQSYTQGLFFEDGQLYESTGLNGKSSFRVVDLQTGKALKKIDFDKDYFVEGSVMFKGNLYILTWENRVAFVYDAKTLKYKTTYKYPRPGWGITTDGDCLIASDGTANLYFMDENFKLDHKVRVTHKGKPVGWLNELEYIDGRIWANVYTTDEIVIINPRNGEVEGVVDCRGLLPEDLHTSSTDVLNGIAYDSNEEKIYLTGKNWARMYQVKLVKQP
jgi:glutamine cyclotransferase